MQKIKNLGNLDFGPKFGAIWAILAEKYFFKKILVFSVIDPCENLASCKKISKILRIVPVWAILAEQEFSKKFGFAQSLSLIRVANYFSRQFSRDFQGKFGQSSRAISKFPSMER